MAQFKALAPNVEVSGAVVMSVVNAMGAFQGLARRILRESRLGDLQPDHWYPQQAWLDAFEIIAREIGPNTLFHIGTQIPTMAEIPPAIDSIESALLSLDEAYHSTHRGGEIGHYLFRTTSRRSGVMECTDPYPCDFDRGVIDALARRFEPSNAILDVRHDPYQPCKKETGDSCTYTIVW